MRKLAVLGTLVTLSSLSLGGVVFAQDDSGGASGQDSSAAVPSPAVPADAAAQQSPDAAEEPAAPDAAACAANPALAGCGGVFANAAPSMIPGADGMYSDPQAASNSWTTHGVAR